MSTKNHGELIPRERKKRVPAVPQILQGQGMRFGSIEPEEAARLYGKWQMKALKAIGVAGHAVQPGDLFIAPGNCAYEMALSGAAEFTDPKIAEQQEVLDRAKTLGLDLPPKVSAMPEFQQPRRGGKSWVKGE